MTENRPDAYAVTFLPFGRGPVVFRDVLDVALRRGRDMNTLFHLPPGLGTPDRDPLVIYLVTRDRRASAAAARHRNGTLEIRSGPTRYRLRCVALVPWQARADPDRPAAPFTVRFVSADFPGVPARPCATNDGHPRRPPR